MNLTTIARRLGCDKGFDGHDYTSIYDEKFLRLKDSSIVLLEIGIDRGLSLALWHEYFSKARIIGIDNREECVAAATKLNLPRVYPFLANASNPRTLTTFGRMNPRIVIDDGSHGLVDQLTGLLCIFPYVLPGGMYCIEDLHGPNNPMAEFLKSNEPLLRSQLFIESIELLRNETLAVLTKKEST